MYHSETNSKLGISLWDFYEEGRRVFLFAYSSLTAILVVFFQIIDTYGTYLL